MVSRLMLNIQNPSLFGNFSAQGWGGNSETSTLGTFFAAERSSGRRGECTSIRFLGRDIQDDESSLGDPAWHRETQAAIQGPEETESSGACGCGVQPVFSHNLLLCCRCRTSTDFLMIIRWSSMSWVEAIILRQSKIFMAWTSNLCSVFVRLLMLQYHVTSLMCLRPQNLRRFCSQTYYYRSLLLPMQVHENNQGHLHRKYLLCSMLHLDWSSNHCTSLRVGFIFLPGFILYSSDNWPMCYICPQMVIRIYRDSLPPSTSPQHQHHVHTFEELSCLSIGNRFWNFRSHIFSTSYEEKTQ